ncbi:unnamed protein product [Heligmosomoides polygyrus]|uniref:Helicase ATP-binding domain-containing protein n=1 Tax=Heligmosomoides polygyrus TaxID=6339 RepID=A0A3P8B3A5_HELPZ|nr:unnamed protein product [Heligmosomoides polygyrus]
MRPYQEELVETAVRGKNTIACAPTGSGKTEVAIYVAMSHLNQRETDKQPARVAMLVPRTPLVEQQKLRFHTYVRGKYYVEGFHGSGLKGSSRRDIVLACDIVVMTPQILLNMLKSIRQDERLYVCDFSLLIFDEVHHCTKDHPYNILMQMIHDYQGPKPQTMGLTASLGVAQVPNEESGMAAIFDLMANMGATALASVKRHVDILAQWVPKPDDGEWLFLMVFNKEGATCCRNGRRRRIGRAERVVREANNVRLGALQVSAFTGSYARHPPRLR